ncbi:TyrR/PhhR family helix-turn-helix DNA-binding protein [Pseudohongiella spirulinae]|uniref:Transcriptional regulatory protein TyrR n=1 Tax=Pseudohongiella spirulinae TaxID=1249552 RepID=A0A0S2KGI3_9GAMM|nr:TyrR/PhhR family helix-turn-helix DNA-binding protein [Pseudohongiella spirulinae]ALO47419.1 hypothetical protein PS2015_2787 [Pseudohongiella spirulinae]
MRVEVICQNRLGILHSIMGILVEFRINLAKGEVGGDNGNAIYFYAPGMLRIQYSSVKPLIEKLPGVRRVRRISLMPSERRHTELKALLTALDYPVLSINTRGEIIAANLAAARVFGQRVDEVPGLSLNSRVSNVDLMLMIERHNARFNSLPLIIRGRTWLADIAPVYADDAITEDPEASLAGAVITLKPLVPVEQGVPEYNESSVDGFGALYPHGREMRDLLRQAKQLAGLSVPLWITGEDGAGKERLARACHMVSDYAGQAFHKLYCDDAGDAEFAEKLSRFSPDNKAVSGTLYVTDAHRLTPRGRVRLAELYDAWGASGSRLRLMVGSLGDEDEQLMPGRTLTGYRLALPPLRERREGWDNFIEDVLDAVCRQTGKPMPVLDLSAQQALRDYHWPQNLRELERVLMQSVLLAKGKTITRKDLKLPDPASIKGQLNLTLDLDATEMGYKDYCSYIDRELLGALYPNYPSARLLGRRLGLSHTAIANRLRRFGIQES